MFLQRLQKATCKPASLNTLQRQTFNWQQRQIMQTYKTAFAAYRNQDGMGGAQRSLTMPLFRPVQLSHFSSGNQKDDSEDYSKKFESLLNKNQNQALTDAEKKALEQDKLEKEIADAEQAEIDEMEREKMASKKAQDFDDLLSGKKQADSEKNLQTLFKEFYTQAKDTDVKGYVNSAKSSIGSLSSTLEKRREKLRQMKADALNIDKDKQATAATDKTKAADADKKKVDDTKDSAKEASAEKTEKSTEEMKQESTDQAKATSSEESQQQEEEKKEEVPQEPKLSMKERLALKMSAINERYAEKYPKAHEKTSHYVGVVADVWQETFPDNEKKTHDKFAKRKERARLAREWEEKQKDMTPEEIQAMEESIPEWKRTALVVASDDEDDATQKRGILGRMKASAADRINQTETAQKFYESEEYKKLEDVRKEVKDFKADLKDQVDASHNPVVQMSAQVADRVMNESQCASAISAMQKYDPDFNLADLNEEVEEIFQEFYCNFLTGNKDYLGLVTGGPASAICNADIKMREEQGWSYRYEELLCCSNCFFDDGRIENRIPQFTYRIEVQEFDEKINTKTGERFEPAADAEGAEGAAPPQSGKAGAIMNNTYQIVLSRHEEPDMEVTGHYWEIIDFRKIGEYKMIA